MQRNGDFIFLTGAIVLAYTTYSMIWYKNRYKKSPLTALKQGQ